MWLVPFCFKIQFDVFLRLVWQLWRIPPSTCKHRERWLNWHPDLITEIRCRCSIVILTSVRIFCPLKIYASVCCSGMWLQAKVKDVRIVEVCCIKYKLPSFMHSPSWKTLISVMSHHDKNWSLKSYASSCQCWVELLFTFLAYSISL